MTTLNKLAESAFSEMAGVLETFALDSSANEAVWWRRTDRLTSGPSTLYNNDLAWLIASDSKFDACLADRRRGCQLRYRSSTPQLEDMI